MNQQMAGEILGFILFVMFLVWVMTGSTERQDWLDNTWFNNDGSPKGR